MNPEAAALDQTKVRIGTLRRRCLYKFDIPDRRMLAAHETGSDIVSTGRPER